MFRSPSPSTGTRQTARASWWLLLIPFLLLAAWLTIHNINQDAIWVDEEISYARVGAKHHGPFSIVDVIESATQGPWPPLYYLILYYWGRLAGWSVFAGRFLSLLIGLPAVALVYRMGRAMSSPRAGVYAAVIFSTSTLYIFYLHEMRGYTLHVLLAVIVVWLYWLAIPPARPAGQMPTRTLRTALFFAVPLLLYTHAMAVPILASIGLYHLLFSPRDEHWSHIIFVMGTGGLLFLPWLLLPLLAALVVEDSNARGMPAWQVVTTSLHVFGNGLFILSVALGLYAPLRLRTRGAGYIAFVTGVSFILALVLNIPLDFLFHVRHLIALIPLVALLIGLALADLHRLAYWAIPVGLCLVWIGSGVFLSLDRDYITALPGATKTLPQPGFDHTLEAIQARAAPEDAVFFQIGLARRERSTQFVLEHYLHDAGLRFAQFESVSMFEEDSEHANLSYRAKVRLFVDDAPRVWTVTVPEYFPQAPVQTLVDELARLGYHDCGTAWTDGDFYITLYSYPPCTKEPAS